MSAFLVRADGPGYTVERVEEKLGQAASDACALRFDDVFVEEDMRLGAEGDGYRIALSNLEVGRIGIAAQCVGIARAALDKAINYARERKSFGVSIISLQAVGFRLADLTAKLAAATQLVLHAATMRDAGLPCLKGSLDGEARPLGNGRNRGLRRVADLWRLRLS